MRNVDEPATATNPANWRVIKEVFPQSAGVMNVLKCKCYPRSDKEEKIWIDALP